MLFKLRPQIPHIFAVLATVTFMLCTIQESLALDTGDEAPDFLITSGEKLSDLRGTVVYLDFWASWCTPCLQSFPWMEQIRNKFRGKKFRVVTVNVDEDRSDADRFLAKSNSTLDVVFDPAGLLPKQYELMTMPTAYLIDSKRRIVSIHAGFRDGEKNTIEEKITRLLEGQS